MVQIVKNLTGETGGRDAYGRTCEKRDSNLRTIEKISGSFIAQVRKRKLGFGISSLSGLWKLAISSCSSDYGIYV